MAGSNRGHAVPGAQELFHVRAFREKPELRVAKSLFNQGALWNTFVMVGRVEVLLSVLGAAVPQLVESLARSRLWAGSETHIEYSVYQRLAAADFCKSVLAKATERLLVLRHAGLAWNDLGDPARASRTIRRSLSAGVAA